VALPCGEKNGENKNKMLKFFKKKNYFLGIDFGTSSLKVVELSFSEQRTHLVNYGWVDFNSGESNKEVYRNSRLKIEGGYLQKSLNELLKKMEIKSKQAYVSIAGFNGLIALIEIPNMEKSEMEQVVKFEAHKYIPASLDEVFLSWDIVSKEGIKKNSLIKNIKLELNNSGKVKILLVAALKKEVLKYEKLINGSGLEMKALELEMFSMVRSLVGNDLGNFMIIDIGARNSNIILAEKGILKINRSVDIGGNEITKTIAESMNISKQRAESLKKQKRDFFNSHEGVVMLPSLDLIAKEAQRIIRSYESKNEKAHIDSVILSGGTAKLLNISNYFSKILGIKTIVGNPWSRIDFDESLSPYIKEIGPSFSVALGLALRGVDEYKRK